MFYDTGKYVPKVYVDNLFFLQWTGLELDSIKGLKRVENGDIEVLIKWYGFEEEENSQELLENVVPGAHKLLTKCMGLKEVIRSKLGDNLKDKDVKTLLDDEFKNYKKTKLFAGNNCSSDGWIHIGEEINERSDIKVIYIKPEEIQEVKKMCINKMNKMMDDVIKRV